MKSEEVAGLLGVLFGAVILAYLFGADVIQTLCIAGIATSAYFMAIAKNAYVTAGGSVFILALLAYLFSSLEKPELSFSFSANIPIIELLILFIIIFCLALAYALISKK